MPTVASATGGHVLPVSFTAAEIAAYEAAAAAAKARQDGSAKP